MTAVTSAPAPPAQTDLARLLVEIAELADEVILITETGSIDEPGPAIVYVNPAFTRMTGYRPEALLGQTPRVLQGPKTSTAARARIRSALRQWQPLLIELTNYRKDGSEFQSELTIVPVADHNGWFRYWVSVQRDVGQGDHGVAPSGALSLYFSLLWLTQRSDRAARSEQTLALETASLAALDQLVASGTRGVAGTAAPEARAADAVARNSARVIEAISARIVELLESPKVRATDIQPIDAVAVVQACVANHQGAFARRQQGLAFESTRPEAPCLADAQLLAQVLTRLLANASESMLAGQGCQVSVTAAPGGMIRIQVSDTGSGIAPELVRNVFHPFFTTKVHGLGLGLPLARVIIERFGGCMHLHSQIGAGTTVHIDLPEGPPNCSSPPNAPALA